MTPEQAEELREQIQGAYHMAEVSPNLVRAALIHMDAAVRRVGELEAAIRAHRAAWATVGVTDQAVDMDLWALVPED